MIPWRRRQDKGHAEPSEARSSDPDRGVLLGPRVISGSSGAETRMDHMVIGDNVNVAFRLESNAGTEEVLISEGVYGRIRGIVVALERDPIFVKNRVKPVQPCSVRLRA